MMTKRVKTAALVGVGGLALVGAASILAIAYAATMAARAVNFDDLRFY